MANASKASAGQGDTIKSDGEKARALFLQHVASAQKSTDENLGDAFLPVDGTDAYVEIKRCSDARGTVNQIRAEKYICCVTYVASDQQWWVLAPHDAVREAANRTRGQHTENPFECFSVGLSTFKKSAKGPFSHAELKAAIEAAVRSGRQFPDVQQKMMDVSADCEKLAARHLNDVKVLLAKLKLN